MGPAPGRDVILALAARSIAPDTLVLDVASGAASALPGRRVETLPTDGILGRLEAWTEPVDGLVALQPTRLGPLIPHLRAFHDALKPDGRAVVSDLVWQTAPTPELMRAFAPPPGGEKVRPIEGYEMQLDHAGFAILERVDLDRAQWTGFYDADAAKRDALAADARGAAKVAAWVLAPRSEE